jgi:hypothetical protein
MARRSKRVAKTKSSTKSKIPAKSKLKSAAKPKLAATRNSPRKAISAPRHAPAKAALRQSAPIDLYYWSTPNGWKITIMLEECGLSYNVIPVNIAKGDQFKPEFLAISPNNRMPAKIGYTKGVPMGGDLSVVTAFAIVRLPGNRTIVVDAKVPFEAFYESVTTSDDVIRVERLKEHARLVRAHIGALSRKSYWEAVQPTPEFVLLFLPGENGAGRAAARSSPRRPCP